MSRAELEPMEELLGHRFREPRWLEQALTHSTWLQEAGAEEAVDNERLEFLGDAVVGLLVSQFLAHAYPDWTAGQLSQARARLVNAESLSEAARRLNLGQHLRLGRGEEKTGGREKQNLLADAYEALVAALYKDGGLDVAWRFLERTLMEHALAGALHTSGQQDHKSALQEFLQARGQPPADYRVAAESGPDHHKHFLVEVVVQGRSISSGEGSSKKKAEQQAAAQALDELRKTESR